MHGGWLYRNCISEETRQALTELLLEEGVPFEVYCEGESWIQRDRLEGVLTPYLFPLSSSRCSRSTPAFRRI